MSGRYHSYISNQLSHSMDFSQMPIRVLISKITGSDIANDSTFADEEVRTLQKLFSRKERSRTIELISSEYLYRLREKAYTSSISYNESTHFLHLSGPELTRPDEIHEWVEVIGAIPGLQMVFLNGCATVKMVEQLMLKDIPLVIATNARILDARITHSAEYFYSLLLNGMSLLEAFERMDNTPISESQIACACYDLESDSLQWERPVKLNSGKPHLFLLADHVDILQTSIPEQLANHNIIGTPDIEGCYPVNDVPVVDVVRDVEEEHLFEGDPEKSRQLSSSDSSTIKQNLATNWKMLIFTCILLIGGICSFSYYLYRPEMADICVFNSEEDTYNVLILPFSNGGQCELGSSPFTQTVWGFFHEFSNKNLNIQLQPNTACYLTAEMARNQMYSCHVDLLIWGKYTSIDPASSKLELFYMIKSEDNSQLKTQKIETTIDSRLYTSSLPQDIEQEFRHLMGIGLIAKNNHELAIKTLNEIPKKNNISYIPIAASLSEAFAEMGDYPNALYYQNYILSIDSLQQEALHKKAVITAQIGDIDSSLFIFNKLLVTYPNYADAYYNRSLLHLKQGHNDLAKSDIEKTIRLRPADGNSYGLLATIYAQQHETDLFYQNFEIALKAGMDLDKFLVHTPIREYQEENRFQQLLSKYP